MRWLYTLPLRLRSLLRRSRVDDELDEEFRGHVERETQAWISRGLSIDEARFAALKATRGIEQRKEDCRELRRTLLLDVLLRDFTYAYRTLRRSPGFVVVAILSLALG